jgi:hypothetical protein
MSFKRICLSICIIFFVSSISAEEMKNNIQNNQYNIYTGMFDFSDDGKKSTLVGFQHQNENLNRDTFLGNLSPITGILITADSAGYVYTGVQAQYKIGALNITPSFTPGLYHEGDGKILDICLNLKAKFNYRLIYQIALNLVFLIIICLMQVWEIKTLGQIVICLIF